MRFNTTESKSLGKNLTILVGILSSVDVVVVEALSSFLKSHRENSAGA